MQIVRGVLLSSCLVALAASAAFTLPPGWSKAGAKPVYSRSLGPPAGEMGSISVPYMPKSPMFPKFVDPKMMISKKTDMLANLFGGAGPAAYNPAAAAPAQYGAGGFPPFLASILEENKASEKVAEARSAKGKVADESELYKRGIFGPFSGPKFGGMGSKFGAMPQYPTPDMMSGYGMSDYSRKRRSIATGPALDLQAIFAANKADTKGPPPPYPTLSPIAEEPEAESMGMLKMGSATPKESMPGMFSPFGPVVNPSMFITKKYSFLDTLFKNIATSTPAPATTTAEPVPKSTIVPPSFWFPTSMIPTPGMYNDKVSEFLDKLFESLQLNKTAPAEETASSPKSEFVRSVEEETDETESRVARSIEDLSSIVSAKDAIVDNILAELGTIKGDMVTTINDFITLEKSMAMSMSMMPKKAMKPFGPGMWPKGAKPDISLPFQQKIMVLSQVFDMLTELQKNITTAVQQAIDTKIAASQESTTMNANVPEITADAFFGTTNYPLNLTLLDAIKKRLSSIGMDAPSYGPGPIQMGSKFARMAPEEPTSFWVSYPATSGAKREISEDFAAPGEEEERNDNNQNKQKRGVKMQLHQGYQGLPAGSIETVQAGGGATPEQQGGGIKLLGADANGNDNAWFDWMQYLRNEHQGHRHNHNHH